MRRMMAGLAVLGVLALGLSGSAVPAEDTEASWTHQQPAQSETLQAATVPPVVNLRCTGSLVLGRLTVNWSHPQMSIPRQGYQIQRFAPPSSTTPTHTFTVGPNATQYVNSNLALLQSSRWEVRVLGPGGWVSAPWAMEVFQLATALVCERESGPRT